MANIRLGQQLSSGYNPDGTPGTVSTGVPGPPPSPAQVLAAVETYLLTNPVAAATAPPNTAPLTKHGVGADGSAGAWVGVGDNGSTVSGYVVAGGSPGVVDLHLAAQGAGKIYLDNPVGGQLLADDVLATAVSAGSATVSGTAAVTGVISLGTPVAATDAALSTAATDIKATTIRKTAANRRGFLLSELPSDVVVNGQIDVLGVLATLWAQVKTLTP